MFFKNRLKSGIVFQDLDEDRPDLPRGIGVRPFGLPLPGKKEPQKQASPQILLPVGSAESRTEFP
jgi:hypothetical protein